MTQRAPEQFDSTTSSLTQQSEGGGFHNESSQGILEFYTKLPSVVGDHQPVSWLTNTKALLPEDQNNPALDSNPGRTERLDTGPRISPVPDAGPGAPVRQNLDIAPQPREVKVSPADGAIPRLDRLDRDSRIDPPKDGIRVPATDVWGKDASREMIEDRTKQLQAKDAFSKFFSSSELNNSEKAELKALTQFPTPEDNKARTLLYARETKQDLSKEEDAHLNACLEFPRPGTPAAKEKDLGNEYTDAQMNKMRDLATRDALVKGLTAEERKKLGKDLTNEEQKILVDWRRMENLKQREKVGRPPIEIDDPPVRRQKDD